MKEKHFTADEQCQAEEKNEEMSQAVGEGSLETSSKSYLQPSHCSAAMGRFYTWQRN